MLWQKKFCRGGKQRKWYQEKFCLRAKEECPELWGKGVRGSILTIDQIGGLIIEQQKSEKILS